ncbi:MAG: hypothetical protein M3065_21350 [Actinomycetota bacterium]|nr:hypothetical protein [Actinomycetota bacterium]
MAARDRDLLGLGETGDASDADRLSPWLQNPRPGYRRAALIGSVSLLRDEAIHSAAKLLDDPSPRVAGTATRLLNRFQLPHDLIAQLEEQASHGTLFLKAELADWHRRSARITTGPPKTHADEIQARLGVVDDASARSIAFVLRTSTPPR